MLTAILVPSSNAPGKRVGFLPAGLEAIAKPQFKMLVIELNFGQSPLFSGPPNYLARGLCPWTRGGGVELSSPPVLSFWI